MAFCTQCGHKVEDGDKFCQNCGALVRQPVKADVMDDGTAAGANENGANENGANENGANENGVNEKANTGAKAETASKAGADDGAATTTAKFDAEKAVKGVPPTSVKSVNKKLPTPAKPANKKLVGGIAAGVLALAVIAALIWKMGGFGEVRDRADYVPYVNDTVCFSVNYPEEYLVTEPNVNSVLITEGEAADFQVSIEYAYYTVGDSAIYSAADFVEQVENDPTVLTDWIGTKNVETEYVGRTKTGNMEREQYHFRLEVEGHPYEGDLYIYDGKGEFGCYTYMCAINQDAKDAELYKIQAGKMADGFQITDACQAEGYHVYTFEENGLQFMVRDGAIYDTKESDGDVTVYPLEREYGKSNVWLNETSYEADVDVLFSLKFLDDADSADKSDEGGAAASGDGTKAAGVIGEIEAKAGFVSDGTFKPLVVAEDFNGDGTRELLAVYEIESGSGVSVMYDVWSLDEKKATCLKSEELFWEVGGNGGSVGIAKSGKTTYLAIEAKEPDGDGFHNYYEYIPWAESESAFLEDGEVYMEAHGNVEQPDKSRYIVGDITVEKSKFDERQKDFEWIYKLDILAGATDDGVMTFDEARNL